MNGTGRALSLDMTRSLPARSFAVAIALVDALVAMGYAAHVTSDSKGRATVITDASEHALISVES